MSYWELITTLCYCINDAKRKAYAAAEIQEYWVVDLKHRQLKVFRNPTEGNYNSELTLTTGEICSLAFPDIKVSYQFYVCLHRSLNPL